MFLAVTPVNVTLVTQNMALNVNCEDAGLVDNALNTMRSIQITSVR
jgi:hypothetical protein